MNTANVIPFSPRQSESTDRPTGGKVADCDNGYTRIANELYEAILATNLTMHQLKVVMAVIRKTYGFNKKSDRITNGQISGLTGIPETRVCTAKNFLIEAKILVVNGREIGVNKVFSEWDLSIPQKGEKLPEMGKKTFPKMGKKTYPKEGNTKDKRQPKDNTPIVPCGDEQSADAELPDSDGKKKTSSANKPGINYQAFADVYNEILGDRLPTCAVMNDKRKRALKKLLTMLKAPTLDCFSAYLNAFAHTARPFYFGDNDRGWRASFDFVIRQDTLTATKEGSIADNRFNAEGDDE